MAVEGYNGKILRVDLSSGNIEEREFDEKYARHLIGGNGFAAEMIHEISADRNY